MIKIKYLLDCCCCCPAVPVVAGVVVLVVVGFPLKRVLPVTG